MLFLSVLLWCNDSHEISSIQDAAGKRELIEEQWLQWWDSQPDDGSDYLEILENSTIDELIAMMAIGRKS